MNKPLEWITKVNGTFKVARGRYAGWSYELNKASRNNWQAWFVDEHGTQTLLIGGRTFAEARKAAADHHAHPGFSGF